MRFSFSEHESRIKAAMEAAGVSTEGLESQLSSMAAAVIGKAIDVEIEKLRPILIDAVVAGGIELPDGGLSINIAKTGDTYEVTRITAKTAVTAKTATARSEHTVANGDWYAKGMKPMIGLWTNQHPGEKHQGDFSAKELLELYGNMPSKSGKTFSELYAELKPYAK